MTKTGAHKLTYEKAYAIQTLLNHSHLTHSDIANMFGISRVMVTHIKKEYRWGDLKEKFNSISSHTSEGESPSNPLKTIHTFMNDWGIEEMTYEDMKIFMIKNNSEDIN